MVVRHSERALAKMRKAGEIVARVLHALEQRVAPGVTTAELDALAETIIRDYGAIPSFKGYRGYPATICASINEEIVHGIPGARRLQEGDIVSLDVGAIWKGYHGDAAITVAVGTVSDEVRALIAATQQALMAGIAAVRAGARLGDISHTIEAAAHAAGFEVVREYGGHGIGRQMHEPPLISNWGTPGTGVQLRAGMAICLEPMLTLRLCGTRVLEDGWTVITANRTPSAHFEHTIVVTEDGAEILTCLQGDGNKEE